MQIKQLDLADRRDVRRWVRFPYELYRKSAYWVPPLRADEARLLDTQKHPYYQHSPAAFFVAEDGSRAVGRICALNNRNYNQHSGRKRAFFGYLEMVQEQTVCDGLFEVVTAWARAQGLVDLAGPRDLLGADAAGVLVEGFDRLPAMGVPWNYPYYDPLIQAAGLTKDTDHLDGYLSGDDILPERFERVAERVPRRHGFRVKAFGPRENLRQWIAHVARIYAEAFSENHEFYPLIQAETELFAETILSVIGRRLVKLVMLEDEVVGFLLAYPNISRGLQRARGHLWPLGWCHLLWDKRFGRHLDVNGVGVLPPYQGLRVNALLYCELAKSVKALGYKHLDVVQVDEGNYRSRSDQEAIGVRWVKRHRSYYRDL